MHDLNYRNTIQRLRREQKLRKQQKKNKKEHEEGEIDNETDLNMNPQVENLNGDLPGHRGPRQNSNQQLDVRNPILMADNRVYH